MKSGYSLLSITFLLLAAVISESRAQTTLGMRTGILMSTVTGRAEPQAVGAGPTAGFKAEHRFNRFTGINAELLFDEKGYVSRGMENGNKVKNKYRLFYLDLPVSARVYFSRKKSEQGHRGLVGFGPHIGIGLYEKTVRVEYLLFEKEKFLLRQPFQSENNRLEAGVDIELGFIANLNDQQELEVLIRQSFGLNKFREFDLLGKVRNIYVSLSVAYGFRLGKTSEKTEDL